MYSLFRVLRLQWWTWLFAAGPKITHQVHHEASPHKDATSTSKMNIQPRVSKPRVDENKPLSIDDDIFQRLEQLEEEELAAEKTADSKDRPLQSNEAVLAKHVDDLSSKPDNGILNEFDSTESCMGLETPEKRTQATAESASKLKKTVSWNDKESVEPLASSESPSYPPILNFCQSLILNVFVGNVFFMERCHSTSWKSSPLISSLNFRGMSAAIILPQ